MCRTVLDQVDEALWCANGNPSTGLFEEGNLFLDLEMLGELRAPG
jgi:hypothetical protein